MEKQYREMFMRIDAPEELRQRVMTIPSREWKPRRLPKIAALAAAVVVLTAGAWAVETIWGVSVTEMVTGEQESRYEVSWLQEPYPSAAFSEDVAAAMEEVRRAYREYKPYDNWFPGHWQRRLDSWQEMEIFLGVSLSNPLEEQVWLTEASSSTMPLTEEMRHCELNLQGNARGRLQEASLQAGYLAEEGRLALTVWLFTEHSGQDSMTNIWPEVTDYVQDSYQMSDGQEALVMTAEPRREASYTAVEAYFLRDGGLYCLRAVGEKGEEQATRQLLERALDCF